MSDKTDGKQQPEHDPHEIHAARKRSNRLLWGVFSLLLTGAAALFLFLPREARLPGLAEIAIPALQNATQPRQAQLAPIRPELNRHLLAARAYERFERWQDAIDEYDKALAIDADNSEALEGRNLSISRNNLDRYLGNILADPWRLTETEIYLQTVGIYNNALTIGAPNTQLGNQLREIRNYLEAAVQNRNLTILSDGETHITLNGNGELGTFTSHELQLRPGTYTLQGSHSDCETMVRDVTIPLIEAVPTVSLRCETEQVQQTQ